MAVLALEKGDQKNAAKYIKVTAILIVFSICFGLTTLFVSVAFSRPMREKVLHACQLLIKNKCNRCELCI